MINPKKHVVEYTVLDLCDETYYDSLGFKAYELLKTPTGPRVFTIVCLNSKRNDNEKTHSFLLEDYECFRVPEFGMDMTVQQIADLSYAKNLPVMATVDGYQEKCVILASCQRLWADWFASIFIKGYDELEESLKPVILPLLIEHNSRLRQYQPHETQTNEGWEKCLSPNEKSLLNALNEWINKPLEPLIADAINAPSGVSWDRVRVEDGQTIAILVAVHPKAEPWESRVQHYFQENRGNSIDSISGANFYLIMEEAFNTARQGLATIFVIRNPDVVLIASVSPDAIKKIEADFL